MKLIYVCSPYSGDIEANTDYARKACRHVVDSGRIRRAIEKRSEGLLAGRNIVDDNTVPFGARSVLCLVTGRVFNIGIRAKDTMAVETVLEPGEYSFRGAISDKITENKRALECLEDIAQIGGARYAHTQECYEMRLFRNGYTDVEMFNKALKELPRTIEKVRTEDVNARMGGLVGDGVYREYLRTPPKARSEYPVGNSSYVLEADRLKGRKTINVISIPAVMNTIMAPGATISTLSNLLDMDHFEDITNDFYSCLAYKYSRGKIVLKVDHYWNGKRSAHTFSGVDIHGIIKAYKDELWKGNADDELRDFALVHRESDWDTQLFTVPIVRIVEDKKGTSENFYILLKRYSKIFQYIFREEEA